MFAFNMCCYLTEVILFQLLSLVLIFCGRMTKRFKEYYLLYKNKPIPNCIDFMTVIVCKA